jgi:hypothetical protein
MHEAQNARLKKQAMRYRDLSTRAQRQAASTRLEDIRDAYWGLALQWNVLANEVEARLVF